MRGQSPTYRASAGAGKHRVEISLTPVGGDIVAVISGGDRPHVGAVAVAIPRPSLKDGSKTSSTSSVVTLLAHKDDEVARMAAEALASRLNRVVVASAGLHVNKASGADIRKLVQNAKTAVAKAAKIKLTG